MIKSDKGFFAIGMVLIIFLSFIPVLNMLSDSLENMDSLSFTYKSKRSAISTFKKIEQNLQNYTACSSTFRTGNPQGYDREVNEIKDLYNNSLFSNNNNNDRLHFKKAVLCLDSRSTNPKCKNTTSEFKKHSTKDTYINIGSMYLEIYSEWMDELITKTVPIFIEVDQATDGTILNCSTAVPALNSEICESIDVVKVCCRYKHTFNLNEVDKATAPESALSISLIKRYNNTHSYITSASDPSNSKVDEECSDSLTTAKLKAVCQGSSWDYIAWCE